MNSDRILSPDLQVAFFEDLKKRFEKNKHRHPDILWSIVEQKLLAHPQKLWSLNEMEETGGEPDVIGIDEKTDEILFADCTAESPAGRRSLCYDREGWESRKENRPANNAIDLAERMGVEILDEKQYRFLQSLEPFDRKTSSWLKTPNSIRELGGAIFGDCRYKNVFIYHNGAQSYYAARGFRTLLRL